MKNKTWVYDIETFLNFFCVVFKNIETEEIVTYHIFNRRLIIPVEELLAFLDNRVDALIGYNNIDFDGPVLQYISDAWEMNILTSSTQIYNFAQELINAEIKPEKLQKIRQLDLFRLHHFNNAAKSTSLKWLQCHLKMDNIQEMPFDHNKILKEEDIPEVISYCVNDVETTYQLYKNPKTQELLKVRKEMTRLYGYDMINLSNASMGEKIFEIEANLTEPAPPPPKRIHTGDLLLPMVRFRTEYGDRILDFFRTLAFDPLATGKIKHVEYMDGLKYEFGLGGLHAAVQGTFFNIESRDVTSYYPNLAIKNRLKPRHLSYTFCDTYERLFIRRSQAAKKTPTNLGLKESLNSVFGKANSEFSKLYDPTYLYTITVNGQLLLFMLCEAITRTCAGKVIMANTDGIEFIVYDEEKIDKIMKRWQEITQLTLEGSTYSRILIRDVNNYCALTTTNEIKAKGAYEYEREFHKDPSARIVPLAVHEWMKGVPFTETLEKHKDDLHLFFMFARAKTGKFEAVSKNASTTIALPKTIRYLMTRDGWILKKKTDKKQERVHKSSYVGIFNKFDPATTADEILLNMKWYEAEIKSLLDPIHSESDLFTLYEENQI
jgi:hypothetical protein